VNRDARKLPGKVGGKRLPIDRKIRRRNVEEARH
jgi:hypothetical protein